ncbi:hypothetical protein Tco_0673503 [Tanacetum coccineum]
MVVSAEMATKTPPHEVLRIECSLSDLRGRMLMTEDESNRIEDKVEDVYNNIRDYDYSTASDQLRPRVHVPIYGPHPKPSNKPKAYKNYDLRCL